MEGRDWGPISDAEFERQSAAAETRSRKRRALGRYAVDAWYDRESGRIAVQLANGCYFEFPSELAQGLRGADPEVLEQVEVSPAGLGLSWEAIDVDLAVDGLLHGVFGNRQWMREMGRLGGRSRSEAKVRAARKNGLKGGRPRKSS